MPLRAFNSLIKSAVVSTLIIRSDVPITVHTGVDATLSASHFDGLPATGMAAVNNPGYADNMLHVPVPPIEPPNIYILFLSTIPSPTYLSINDFNTPSIGPPHDLSEGH